MLAVDDQSAYGKPLADQVAKLLKAQGVKVKRASVTQKTSDYSSVITSMSGDTDLVYLALQLPDKMTLFGNQLKEQGKNVKVFLSDAGGSGVKLPGAYFSTFGPDVTHYPPARSVLKAYHQRYGAKAPVTAFGPLAYVSGQVVVDAVARACKNGTATRAEVLKELHKTNLKKSVFGDPIRFDAPRRPDRRALLPVQDHEQGIRPRRLVHRLSCGPSSDGPHAFFALSMSRALVTVHSPPEPGFARREAHAREATSGRALRAAGSSTARTTRDVLKEGPTGESGVHPCLIGTSSSSSRSTA